jgi:fumarate reductase flavoprotein subunit
MHARAYIYIQEAYMKFLSRWLRFGALVLGALFFSCVGGSNIAGNAPQRAYANGVWEGSGRGYRGTIHVRVRVASALIQEIEIGGHGEDPFIGGAAMEELLEQVLEYQTTDVDAVSGATESSEGFLAAVEDALNRAR